jgi:hypothetical protein
VGRMESLWWFDGVLMDRRLLGWLLTRYLSFHS